MRYKKGASISIHGESVQLTMFASTRNIDALFRLAEMPSVEELRKCLTLHHKDEIWLSIDQK